MLRSDVFWNKLMYKEWEIRLRSVSRSISIFSHENLKKNLLRQKIALSSKINGKIMYVHKPKHKPRQAIIKFLQFWMCLASIT
jgi:hypothetical protein